MRLAGTATAVELGSLEAAATGTTRVRIVRDQLSGFTLFVEDKSETQIKISGLGSAQIELGYELCQLLCQKAIDQLPRPEHPIAQPKPAPQTRRRKDGDDS